MVQGKEKSENSGLLASRIDSGYFVPTSGKRRNMSEVCTYNGNCGQVADYWATDSQGNMSLICWRHAGDLIKEISIVKLESRLEEEIV